MIKYLRWNTANKRVKDLIANTNFDEVHINDKAGNYTFLVNMPSGEYIELWLSPSDINAIWYCNGDEKACINPKRHLVARKFVYELYKAIRQRTNINKVERAFYKVIDGAFNASF